MEKNSLEDMGDETFELWKQSTLENQRIKDLHINPALLLENHSLCKYKVNILMPLRM